MVVLFVVCLYKLICSSTPLFSGAGHTLQSEADGFHPAYVSVVQSEQIGIVGVADSGIVSPESDTCDDSCDTRSTC